MTSPSPGTIIIGAGIAGLAAALDLARQGRTVTVYDAGSGPGGKLRPGSVSGRLLDAGPTVLTLRPVFEELFAVAGARLDALLDLEPATVLARHAWPDGARFDLLADPRAATDAVGDFAGAAEARRFTAFRERARAIHDTLAATFMHAPRPSLADLLQRAGVRGLPGLLGLAPFRSLWRELGRHFRDPHLRQLFARYATYCGSSPFQAPATLMLIAHVELSGVWRVAGGMHRLATALMDLASHHGARFHFDTQVSGLVVEYGRIAGVTLPDGTRVTADSVVFNGDRAALASGRLGSDVRHAVPAARRDRRSLSALTWAWCGRLTGFDASHHNVCFSDDYAAEFDALTRRLRLPATPTAYLCAQDRPAAEQALPPAADERLFCLVNAPATGDAGRPDRMEIDRCETETFAHLVRCGFELERDPETTLRRTPQDWAHLFPGTGGALYGEATHGWQAAFRRPGSRSRVPGLYLAGGSVHPGAGLPMATLSGRLAASALMADLGSIRRSPRAATSGGTSTASATTAATRSR